MKLKIIITALVLAGIIVTIGWQMFNNKRIGAVSPETNYQVLELTVEGMVCPQCASAINIFLETKEGILRSAIDYKEGGGTVVYNSQKITQEEILSFGILKDFYKAELVKNEIFIGEIEEKVENTTPEVAEREKKLKESSAILQLFLSARQKKDEFYIQSLSQEYILLLDELVLLDNKIEDENEKREFHKKVLAETSDQIYLIRPSLPGEPAYEAKKKAEDIQIILAVNPVLKTKSTFLSGNSRLNEASVIFDENNEANDVVETLIGEYKNSLEKSIVLLQVIEKKGETKKELLVFGESVKELIREQLPKQEVLIEKIYGSVPFDIQKISSELLTLAS